MTTTRPVAENRAADPPARLYQACLLGGAIGDALGAPVEFMSRSDIIEIFGPQGIQDYSPAYGHLGAITDDTQMTLFTAEGIIRAFMRWNDHGAASLPDITRRAYLRWLHTQQNTAPPPFPTDHLDGWLITVEDLYHRRAPGQTCLDALNAGNSIADNDSKGCGALMRLAPVGLFVTSSPNRPAQVDADLGPADSPHLETVFKAAVRLSALTHGHPSGQLPGGVFAVIVHLLLIGYELPNAIRQALVELKKYPDHQETLAAIELAIDLAHTQSLPQHQAIDRLGQGWVAEEALAIAIYCALTADNFNHGVLAAVNHSGDSDSTGSIAGNLLGLIHGLESIPKSWLEKLELRSIITEIAQDLHDAPKWHLGDGSPQAPDAWAWQKYPGR